MNCNNCRKDDSVLLVISNNVGTSSRHHMEVRTCKGCGLTYLDPQPTEDELLAHYSSYGRANRTAASLMAEKEKEGQRDYVSLVAPFIRFDAKILDFACGRGTLLKFFRDEGYTNLHGIDLSQAEKEMGKRDYGLDIEIASIENHTIKDYDLITMVHIIEHLKDPLKTMRAVRDNLNEGGLVFISTPALERLILRKTPSNYFKFVHTYYFSMNTLISILEQAGFEIVHDSYQYLYQSPSYLYPDNYKDTCLNVLARKAAPKHIHKGDSYKDVQSWVGDAVRRDRPYRLFYALQHMPFCGRILSVIRFLVRKTKTR